MTDKKVCPICSKSLSYSGGVFSKHGYQVRYHQHTPSTCFGAHKADDGLVEKYIAVLENYLSDELQKFPNEWLGLSVISSKLRNQKEEYKAFRTASQIQQEINFFKKKLQSAH